MICITIINSIGGTHHKPWLPEEVVLPRASSRSAADHEPHLGPRGRRPYPHTQTQATTHRAGGRVHDVAQGRVGPLSPRSSRSLRGIGFPKASTHVDFANGFHAACKAPPNATRIYAL